MQCHYARCDQCNDAFGEDDMLIHYEDRAALEQALVDQQWVIVHGRVLCAGCVGATSCDLVGHRLGDWWSFNTSTYSGRTRDCKCCGYAEFDPPRNVAS